MAAMLPIRKFDETTTLEVEVRLTREFHVRVAVGLFLIKLAARVMGCRLKTGVVASDNEGS
jgi:hypothetical protein